MAKLNITKEQFMSDQGVFERAMRRVQNDARRAGKDPSFAELLKLAKEEVAADYDRNAALIAHLPDDR